MDNIPNLSYFEIILYFVAIKRQYTSFLSPFFNTKEIKQFKTYIYSLNISNEAKNKLWEYFNNDRNFFL